jgi:RNA polymerase sigma factor (sigma-70 family)
VSAWDAFLERYRGLILATLRHYVHDHDDLMDVFADVCVMLREDDCARMRRFLREKARNARLSTWLVAVTRHRGIDWLRHRDGRHRLSKTVAALPQLQRDIAEQVFYRGRSHLETYELIRSNGSPDLRYGEFLRELSATYRALDHARGGRGLRDLLGPPWPGPEVETAPDPAPDTADILAAALRSLPDDLRAAVKLFVVDDLPAEQVARTLGWPNAKAVYNRVHRALADLRAGLVGRGIGPEDLR